MCSANDDPTYYSQPRKYVLSGQPDPEGLIAAHPLPEGYIIEVTPQREYKYRNLWAIRLYRHFGPKAKEEVWARAYYVLADGIAEAQRIARYQSGWFWSCYICKRTLGEDDADWRNVDFGLHIERVCDDCLAKADPPYEYLEERLDNTDA